MLGCSFEHTLVAATECTSMCIAQQQYLPSSNVVVPCRAISSSTSRYHKLRSKMFKTPSIITRPKRTVAGTNVESFISVSFAVGARRYGRPSPDGAARSFYSTAPVIPTAKSTSNCYPAKLGCFLLSASNIIPVNSSFHTTSPSRFSIRSNSIISKMAATKDYRLLCLENPLLGEFYLSTPIFLFFPA